MALDSRLRGNDIATLFWDKSDGVDSKKPLVVWKTAPRSQIVPDAIKISAKIRCLASICPVCCGAIDGTERFGVVVGYFDYQPATF